MEEAGLGGREGFKGRREEVNGRKRIAFYFSKGEEKPPTFCLCC